MFQWLTNKTQAKDLVLVQGPPTPTTEADFRELALGELARFYVRQISTVFQQHNLNGKVVSWQVAPRYIAIGIHLRQTKYLRQALGLSRELALATRVSSEDQINAVVAGGLLVYQMRLPEVLYVRRKEVRLWTDIGITHPALMNTDRMAVGLALGDVPVAFGFPDEAPHHLICGTTGSGKSTLLTTMLYQMMTQYGPEDLRVAIVSPKGDLLPFQNEEHLLWQPAQDYEDIQATIRYVHAEYQRRRQHNILDAPRWVLVIDEADTNRVLAGSDNAEARQWANDIGLRGRAHQVNLLVGTHMPDAPSIGGLAESLSNRWLGSQPTAKHSGQIEGGMKLHKLAGRGDFYHALPGGQRFRFQSALVTPEELAADLTYTDDIPKIGGELPPMQAEIDIPVVRKAAHRPPLAVKPDTLAYYVFHGVAPVTHTEAKDLLGLKTTLHKRHQDFAKAFMNAFDAIKANDGRWPFEIAGMQA